MSTIYILFMIAFAYMAYCSGSIQNVILSAVYVVGCFLMGLLALAASTDEKKYLLTKKSIDNLSKVAMNKEMMKGEE